MENKQNVNTSEIFIKVIPLTTLEEVCENCGIVPLNKIIEDYPPATNYLTSNERNKFIQHYLNQIKFYALEVVNANRPENNENEEPVEEDIPAVYNFVCFACKEKWKTNYKRRGYRTNE